MDMPKLVLTVEETAKLLRISRGSAYQAVREGKIPTIRIGKRILVYGPSLQTVLSQGGISPRT